MRFNLRLEGQTSTGEECYADVSVHASSNEHLQLEAAKAGEHGPWFAKADGRELSAEDETITVRHVRLLDEPK